MSQEFATSPGAVYAARPVPPRRHALQRTTRWVLRSAERGLGVLVLLVMLGTVLPMIGTGGAVGEMVGGQQEADSRLVQTVFRVVYLYIFLLVAVQPRRFLAALARHKLTWALLALAALSVVWSIDPDATVRRGFRLLLTCAFLLTLVFTRDLRGLLRYAAWALGLAAVLSAIFALLLPAYGLSPAPHVGAWRGVFVHKNTLGSIMTVGALLFVLLARDAERRRWLLWGMAGLCTALVLLSRSTTALVVLATVLVLLPLFRTLRWHPSRLVPGLIFLVLLAGCTGVTVLASYEAVLTALGKDATLTGRTELWSAVAARIQERPLLGYGYMGFWAEGSAEAAELHASVGWPSGNAHNGYLELALETGLLGVLLLLAGLAETVRRAVRLVREDHSPVALWPLALVCVMLMQNLSESGFLYYSDLAWMLYVATVATPDLWRGRRAGAAPGAAGEAGELAPAATVRRRPARFGRGARV